MNAHRQTATKVLTAVNDQPENPALLHLLATCIYLNLLDLYNWVPQRCWLCQLCRGYQLQLNSSLLLREVPGKISKLIITSSSTGKFLPSITCWNQKIVANGLAWQTRFSWWMLCSITFQSHKSCDPPKNSENLAYIKAMLVLLQYTGRNVTMSKATAEVEEKEYSTSS